MSPIFFSERGAGCRNDQCFDKWKRSIVSNGERTRMCVREREKYWTSKKNYACCDMPLDAKIRIRLNVNKNIIN